MWHLLPIVSVCQACSISTPFRAPEHRICWEDNPVRIWLIMKQHRHYVVSGGSSARCQLHLWHETQVPRLAAVPEISVLSGRLSQRTISGGTRTRMAHPTLKWMKGEYQCSHKSQRSVCISSSMVVLTASSIAYGKVHAKHGTCLQDFLVEPGEGGGLFEHVGSTVCV